MAAQQKIGELVYELKVDMADMEKNLLRAEKKMEGTEKKQGGILNMLTSKWAIVGATVAGVGYAMIKASPSLSYAMEEISYRFEDMLAVLGEQFAPLLEDVVIPAIDSLMPVIEKIAPLIGEAVTALVGWLQDEKIQEYIGRILTALSGIATNIWTVLKPALELIWSIFEVIGPPIIENFVTVLELVSAVFGGEDGIAVQIGKVITKITGPLTRVFETFATITAPVREFLQKIIDKLNEEGGVMKWLTKVIGYVEGGFKLALSLFGAIVQPVLDGLQWIIDKIDLVLGWAEDLVDALKSIGEQATSIFGQKSLFNLPGGGMGAWKPGGGFQAGTPFVPREGYYYLHGGEEVKPPQSAGFGGGGPSIGEITIRIDSVSLASDMDVYDFADKLSRRFKEDVQRNWY